MRTHLLCAAALALTLASLAAAQGQTTQQPEAKEPTPAQVEPAENVQRTPQTGPALVNGALAAPEASKDSSTVPAKFSAKNDAEDHLPLMAFTFKNLSAEQKRAIIEGVKGAKTAAPKGEASPDFYANLGVSLPSAVDLRVLPDEVTAKIPQTKAYRYTTVGDKVLLVEPGNRIVVAVIRE
jgi:hypothetical protein